ncbi:restriction endonuclease subunit S [Hymenobacter daeguensis]
MSKETKKTALPKLRFPEFVEAPEWEVKELGNMSDVRDGTHDSPKFYSAGKPLVTSKNLLSSGDLDLKNTDLISVSDYEQINKRSRVDVGDILFGMIGTIGNPVKVKTDGFAIKNVALIKQQEELLNDYLVQFLNSKYFSSELNRLNTGNTQKFIALGILRKIEIFCPPLLEQQKIAAALSSLDDFITAQSVKLDSLQEHKRGLMQGLFPAERETVPKLRFPEFQDAEEWVDTNFYDLLDEVLDFRGRTPPKLGMSWGGGNIVSLSANNVKNGFIDFDAECNLGSEELYDKWMGKVNLEKGDIVFTMEAPLGKALLVPDSQKYILSQRVVAFKTKATVNNPFLIQLIWSKQFQDELEKLSTGSTAKGINQKTLRTIVVKLPYEIEEQQKIAACLSSLDNRITAQTQKIEALKLHKKGLMQNLFPAAPEPTA